MGAIKILNPLPGLETAVKKEVFLNKMTINHWPEEDRPRERLQRFGARNMTDIELLTIIICNGTVNRTAQDLARDLYELSGKDLLCLSNMSIKDFQKVKGIGLAKAITIKAALELSSRIVTDSNKTPTKITDSKEAFAYFKPIFFNLEREEFWIVCLNRRNEVISKYKIGEGTDTKVLVEQKKIMTLVIDVKANSFICAHNHPSGSLSPSQSDINLTKSLATVAKCVEITLIDHIILGGNTFFSFRDSDQL